MSMLWALVSPGLIKLFMHVYAYTHVCVQMEGWNGSGTIANNGMETGHSVAVVDVAMCLTLLPGVHLLVQLCVCRNTLLFFVCGEW